MKSLIVFSLLLSCFGYAGIPELSGGTSSGGGNSVVCFDNAGNIKSAELLDLYEARNQLGLTIPPSDASVLEQVKQAVNSLASNSTYFKSWQPALVFILEQLDKTKIILPKGNGLRRIDDSNNIIVPKNCKIFQLASYEANEKLYLDGDIWDVLDNQNKAALLLHEALYNKMTRLYGETNSVRARELVGHAFAGTKLESSELLPAVAKDLQLCSTDWDDSKIPRFRFLKYLNSEGNMVLQFEIFDGYVMFSKATVSGYALPKGHDSMELGILNSILIQGLNTKVAYWIKTNPSGEDENYINTLTDIPSTIGGRVKFTCKPN